MFLVNYGSRLLSNIAISILFASSTIFLALSTMGKTQFLRRSLTESAASAPIGAPKVSKKAKVPQQPAQHPPPSMLQMSNEQVMATEAGMLEHYVGSLVISIDGVNAGDVQSIEEMEAMEQCQGVYWMVGVHLDHGVYKQQVDDGKEALLISWSPGDKGSGFITNMLCGSVDAEKNNPQLKIVKRSNYN